MIQLVKILSISIDDDIFERFEKARVEKYPKLSRSFIIEQLLLDFLGEEVYFK